VQISSKVRSVRAWQAVAMIATVGALVCSNPAWGQITKTVDEHGKTVYVNADSPKPRHGSTISSASSLSPERTSVVQAKLASPFPGSTPSYAEPKPFSDVTLTMKPAEPVAHESRLDRMVNDAAARHNVDAGLVRAVIQAESGWNTQAISRKGAVGLMQLIPETGQRYGARNLFDPAQNIEAGTSYLKTLLDRYDNNLDKTLAAYNAGENAVDKFGGVPAYAETQKYVQKVSDRYFETNSSRNPSHWAPPKSPVRKAADASGRVTFTNE
jgi:soluble lytic murein transglycosylase-like protein